MPRNRWRATIDSGRKLNLAKLIPRGSAEDALDARLMMAAARLVKRN